MARVRTIDDDAALRRTVRRIAERMSQVAGEAEDGAASLRPFRMRGFTAGVERILD